MAARSSTQEAGSLIPRRAGLDREWVACVLVCGLLLVALPGVARAVSLASLLLPGASLDSGNLRFSDFTYASTGDMALASNVAVEGFTDLDGDDGIRIEGNFEDLTSSPGASGASISYSVSFVGGPPSLSINRVKLKADFSVPGLGYANLNATILNSASLDLIQLYAHNFGTSLAVSDTGSKNLTPAQGLDVVMENIDAFGSTDTAGISLIERSFTVVPEPATALMVGLGLTGLAFASRRI